MEERIRTMAVPKRKTGRARTHSRRSSHKLEAPTTMKCPQCHQPKLPHRVCGECGYYNGREIIDTQ
jgi:large subunit ribosomal protein L32